MTIGWFEAILLFVFWMYLRVSLFFHPGPSKKLAIWAKSTKRRSGLSLGGQESSVRTKGAKTWRALILIWNNLNSPVKHPEAGNREPAPKSTLGRPTSRACWRKSQWKNYLYNYWGRFWVFRVSTSGKAVHKVIKIMEKKVESQQLRQMRKNSNFHP